MREAVPSQYRERPRVPNHDRDPEAEHAPTQVTPFSRTIGRTRFFVLVAVVAVMLVAVVLFFLGAWLTIINLWHAVERAINGELEATALTVEFLEIVSVMLKAVVFYIIGVGLYSLFIAPLNLTAALGMETLNDLETKVISVVIVILAVTFLEHFIRWEDPLETLQFGLGLALVVASLVFFQWHSHRAKEDRRTHHPDIQYRAQRELFHYDHEEREVRPDETVGVKDEAQS